MLRFLHEYFSKNISALSLSLILFYAQRCISFGEKILFAGQALLLNWSQLLIVLHSAAGVEAEALLEFLNAQAAPPHRARMGSS